MMDHHEGADAVVSSAIERQRVAEVMTSYAVACDERDGDALVQLFHPEATASYDAYADLTGGAVIARWVLDATSHLLWQQHAMRVMRVEIDGDRATAIAYLTSHQVAHDTPDTTLMMNSRYDVELRLVDATWRIWSLRLLVGTVEHRRITLGGLIAATEAEAQHV